MRVIVSASLNSIVPEALRQSGRAVLPPADGQAELGPIQDGMQGAGRGGGRSRGSGHTRKLHNFQIVHRSTANRFVPVWRVTYSSFLWVGAVREAGKWRWVSSAAQGEDLMSVPWDYGEPDNTPDQHQLCVHSLGSIKFHDCTRTAMLSAVCQVT
ncbi:hypothetical protein E2C01_023633 [Portunus trituberculatus]|uniref:C-type lectin domain-containing protein n=1 Tax=Portunus trituberculatus TaxID=210409 RepID=A0A5B7E8R1_PORTR|nr:hypothetical protein [Portunus trituberculatus]